MVDISEQKLDDVLRSLDKMTGVLGKIAVNMSGSSSGMSKGKAKTTLWDDLNTDSKYVKNHSKIFKESNDVLTDFTSGMKKNIALAAELFGGYKIFQAVLKYGKEEVKTYQELSGYGQSFGGSMLKMTQSAAAAGVPLDDFAKIIKHNSVVVGQMGTDAFFKLNKELRNSIEQQGLYGYSIEQLGDLQADYMDQQRLAGRNLQLLAGPEGKRELQGFASNLTAISDTLHTQRDEVMKQAMSAMQDSGFLAQERINTLNGMDQVNTAVQQLVTSLAAQPGQASKMLSDAMAQSFGSPGGALFSDLGKQLSDVGLGDLAGVIDDANQAVANGADQQTVAMQTVQKFSDRINNQDTLRSLQVLKMGGDQSAASILSMAASLKTYNAADLKKSKDDRKRTDTLTAFFESFKNIFEGVKGAFIDGFLTPFTQAMGKIDPKTVQQLWDTISHDLEPAARDLGKSFGDFVRQFLTKDNIDAFAHTVVEVVKFGITLSKELVPVVIGAAKMFGSFLSAFHNGIAMITNLLGIKGGLSKSIADIGTAVVGLLAVLAGPKILSTLVGFLLKMVFQRGQLINVSGKIVNVMGGGLGGGIGGKAAAAEEAVAAEGAVAGEAEALAAKAAGKSGLLAKIGAKLAPEGGFLSKMIGGAGDLAGKLIPKGAGKLAGRLGGAFIPGIGAAIDGVSAVNAAKDGNWLASGLYGAGAAVNGVGAALDATGPGAVVGVPLDLIGGLLSGAGVASDVTGFGKGWFGKKKDAVKADDAVSTDDGAMHFTDEPATPGAPTDNSTSAKPIVVDNDLFQTLHSEAIMGNKEALAQFNKISDALNKQTMILASQQKKMIDAQKDTNGTLSDSQGY